MDYCPKCGNTGITIEGDPCTCKLPTDSIYGDLVGIDIPPQYQGLRFAPQLVPIDCGSTYAHKLEELHQGITTLQLQHQNICMCSPAAHAKTVWAYSCIQNLFRQKVPIVALYDVMEIRRVMFNFDVGRCASPDFYDVPYLFARIPAEVTHQVRTTVATLVDRRVRRGMSTIFLFNGSWRTLTYGDDSGILKGMQGDGSFASLKVYNYQRTGESPSAQL